MQSPYIAFFFFKKGFCRLDLGLYLLMECGNCIYVYLIQETERESNCHVHPSMSMLYEESEVWLG